MDSAVALAAFDAQIRRHRGPDRPGEVVERTDGVVRVMSAEGWTGVLWSELSEPDASAQLAANVERFARQGLPWEWKHYSYDEPADLPERLLAAGLVAEPCEALLIAEIADLDQDVPPPAGVRLVPVVDESGVEMLVRLHDEVFGGDHTSTGDHLLRTLAEPVPSAVGVLAVVDGTAVAASRVEFASLWGGGTLRAWRSRGIFRAMVAHRAALAAARGYRYLQVDAMPDSRPILSRLGFTELATTTPFAHPGR
jgi:GNAT superfamily N-acetyltransferase